MENGIDKENPNEESETITTSDVRKRESRIPLYRSIVRHHLSRWNIYNVRQPIVEFSIEHIIPKKWFLHREDSHDLYNLASCERDWNSNRSDYRYGKGKLSYEKRKAGRFYHMERMFFPSKHADFGLIARSILAMLEKYPYLRDILDDIIDPSCLLYEWARFPIYPYELQRNAWRREILNDCICG